MKTFRVMCEVCGYDASVKEDRKEDAYMVGQAHKKGHHKVVL